MAAHAITAGAACYRLGPMSPQSDACARVVRDAPLLPFVGPDGGGYRAIGHGSRLLVMLPGIVGPADALAGLGEVLAADYRTCLVHYPAAPSLDALIAALEAMRAREGRGPTAVCGGSFGALVAQAWLARAPGSFGPLVLSGAGPAVPRARRRTPARCRGWRGCRCRPGGRCYGRRCGCRPVVRRSAPTGESSTDRRSRRSAGPSSESRYRIAIDVDRAGPPSPAVVAAWGGRMLVVEGGRDTVANAKARAALRAVFPGAQFHAFPEAGHGLALDQPDEWLRIVAGFLRAG